jgi:hypothetical protein
MQLLLKREQILIFINQSVKERPIKSIQHMAAFKMAQDFQ